MFNLALSVPIHTMSKLNSPPSNFYWWRWRDLHPRPSCFNELNHQALFCSGNLSEGVSKKSICPQETTVVLSSIHFPQREPTLFMRKGSFIRSFSEMLLQIQRYIFSPRWIRAGAHRALSPILCGGRTPPGGRWGAVRSKLRLSCFRDSFPHLQELFTSIIFPTFLMTFCDSV